MDETHEHGSQVAHLLEKISQEYEAAQQGLSGLAQGTSRHRFITRRMERMGEFHMQLRSLVGDEAMVLIDTCFNEADQRTADAALKGEQEC